jgi:hypothetical protein
MRGGVWCLCGFKMTDAGVGGWGIKAVAMGLGYWQHYKYVTLRQDQN